MMTLEKLLDAIKDTQSKIEVLDKLRECYSTQDEKTRCVNVSYRGNYPVYFLQADVDKILQQRHDGLHVQLNRLLAAKDAAEKTAAGWMYEQERAQ